MPRKDGKRRGRGRVQRVSWNDSLSVMRARTKESPLYTTECSVYYTNGQWLTSPPIETNTWDVYICTCMYICDEVLTGSTYKGSHMVLRVRLILKKKKKVKNLHFHRQMRTSIWVCIRYTNFFHSTYVLCSNFLYHEIDTYTHDL